MSGKIISVIGIIILVLALGYAGSIFLNRQEVISPHIELMTSSQHPVIATKTFPFEKEQVTITVPVNGSVYLGAGHSDKTVRIIGNVSDAAWIADSYRAMVNDPAQDELYRSLITEFRAVKTRYSLSDDEYLELIATYAQSLRYETLAENPAKFPVETVVEGAGDCDDKSLLLAGLLSREGYQVALLSFGPETHMAVGVGSPNYRYKGTNYAFLEVTNLSFVGVPTEKLGVGKVLRSTPLVIPIGEGTKEYTSTTQTQYIHETEIVSEQKARDLEPQVKTLETELSAKQQEILTLESRMQALKSAGNIREYNALVSPHNTKISEYNSRRDAYRQLFSRYEKFAQVHNYIIEHQYDRKGVYEYIRTNLPA
jgi:hypothetical protein